MLYPQQKAIEAAAAALNANTATLHLNETMAATFSYLLPLAPATPLVPETNAAATTLSRPHTSACAFFTQALAKSKSAQAAAISFKPCVHPAAEYCPVLGVWFRTEGDASLLAATDDIAVAESTGADEEFFTAADAALVGAAAAAEVAEVEEEEEETSLESAAATAASAAAAETTAASVEDEKSSTDKVALEEEEESFLIDAVFDDPFFEDDAVCDEEEEEEAVEAAAAAATSISSSDTATSVTDAANSTYDSAAAESSTSKNVADIAADEATAVAATKAATSTTKSKAKPKTTKTTAKSTTAAKTKTKTATTTTTTTAKTKAAPKRTAKATASAAAAEVEAAAEAVDEAAAISAISAAATATKAKAKTTTRRSAKKAAPEISIEEPYSPDNTVATAPFAAASSAATAAAAAVADGEVVDEAVAAAIEAADSAMAAGATTTKGKGGAAASGAKGASAASRGPRTAGIKSVQEFYYWGLAKGFFKPNPAVDTIISMMNLNKDYYQKVTNGILPYLSALTAGNLKDLLSDSSQDMPNLLDIITYNKIFYAALHCLKDSTTGQALGKLLNADLAFVAGQLNAIDDQKHKHVSVFIDEVSELANESLVQMLNKARASKFAITIATQCLADLTRRTGSADAAKQVIGNCNNVLALRVNDLESATIVTDSLPATVIPQKSSTISASEGPACLDTYSTSRTVSQQTASIYPASLMMQLPDFEFIARLANGSVYKAFIPIINDSFTNCLSESELSQLKRDYDSAHATTTKRNTATAHAAAAAGAAAGAATAAATQSETEATAAAADDLYAQIKAASTAAEAKAQAMSNAQPQFEGESAADAEVISPDDDIYTNSTLMDLGFNCYTHNSARTPDNSNADSNSAADSTTGADSAAAAAASYAQEFNSGNVLGGQMSVGSTTTEVPTPGHFFIGGCGNLHSKDKATSTTSSTGASGGGLYAEIKAAYYAQEQAKAQAAAEAAEAAAAAAAAAATATNAATQDAAKTANQSTSPAATQSAAQAAHAFSNAASTAASGTGTGARTGAGATAVAQAAAQGSASSQDASQDSTPSAATDAFSTSSSAAKSASSTASSTAETATAAAASASDSASASASASTKPRGMLGKLKQRVVPALTTVLSKLLSEGAIAEYKRLSIGLAMSLPFILIGCLLPFGNTTLGGFFSSVGDVLAIGSNIVAKGLLILQGSPTAPPRYSLLQLLGFLIHNLLIAYMVCILGAITGERLRSKSELYHQTLIGTLSLLMWAPAILLVLALVSYYYDFVYYPEFTMLFYLSAIFYVSMRGTALISMRSK